MKTKQIVLIIVVGVVAAIGISLLIRFGGGEPAPVATSTPPTQTAGKPERSVIGSSVEGRELEAYTFLPARTDGVEPEEHLVFVGAIHGGYEWNTVLLSYELMDHLEVHPELIPENLKVTVIPVLNPDGLHATLGTTGRFATTDAPPTEETKSGRFNANSVDLNRNFDCNWQPESMWQSRAVSAGTAAFSEPEAAAIRDFVAANDPSAVIFFHSAANGVYGASCNNGILPETVEVMNTYANAAGYPAIESFDHYEITGDVEGWLAKLGIPSVSVELATHDSVEWEKNRAGIEALLQYYGK